MHSVKPCIHNALFFHTKKSVLGWKILLATLTSRYFSFKMKLFAHQPMMNLKCKFVSCSKFKLSDMNSMGK